MDDKKLDKIEDKLDKVLDEVSAINVTLARNTADLEHHIKRTTLAEENIQLLREEISINSTFRNKVEGAFKLVGMVGSGLGILFAAVKAVEVLITLL